ncbi:MAG: hypothetical protein ABJB01_02975 [Rudaea sp.]
MKTRIVVHLMLLASAALASMPALCGAQLENVSVSNREKTWPESIGVVGTPDFVPSHSYSLVLHPTLDASSPTGLKIPASIGAATAELKKALPTDYQKVLRLKKTGGGHAYCASAKPAVDSDVIGWMVVAWNLRDPKGALLLETHTEPKGELYPDLIANTVFGTLCIAK